MPRAPFIPRSFWLLLLAAAALAVWLLRDGGDPERPAPLVPVAAADVVRVAVTGGAGAVELRRGAEGWSLHGDLRDALQPGAVDDVVAALAAARRTGASLPPDPAYGLDDPDALQVAVAAADGRAWSLVLGAVNPVTGALYVLADDGRVHLAEPAIRDRLARLPDSVRARAAWPAGPAAVAADTVTLRRGDAAPWTFARDRLERWWWRAPVPLPADATGVAGAYRAVADDRLRRDGDADWWLADDRRLRNLLSALADAPVMTFHAGDRPLLGDDGRTPPLTLAVSAGGERRSYVLGGITAGGRLDAWRSPARRGFETRAELREIADVSLADWLHADALTLRLAVADSFALAMPHAGAATAHPVLADPDRPHAPRDGWAPVRGAADPDEALGDLAHLVDRLTMGEVRGLEPDPSRVFDDQPRLTLTTWQRGPGLPPVQVLEIGVARGRDAVVARRPDDGLVVTVPNTLLVSGRNYLRARTGPTD